VDVLLLLSLLFTALLGGAIVYLFANQRHFQRVDYQQLINSEERERQQLKRLKHLERIIADMVAHDKQRRWEMEQLVKRTKRELAESVAKAREEIITDIMRQPSALDSLLLQQAQVLAPQLASSEHSDADSGSPSVNTGMGFAHSPLQQRIAATLEEGWSTREIAEKLGVSLHEVELVNAIHFQSRTA
jgi:IS30 family transposase